MKQSLLKRRQISAQLNNLFDYPLTVVTAAMGYGKTTAVRDFLAGMNARYVWLSIESDETSAQYIWASLTRQLAKTEPELGNPLHTLGFPADAPQRDRIIHMIADYTYSADTILVIDDYHLAHSPELDRLLERIVRTEIQGLHLVIISRTKPDLNIDELELKGYCYLFKSELFELSKEEIKKYFKLFGRDISAATAAQVHRISEGWIAAVYLIVQRYCEIGRLEPGRNIESLIETAIMSRYSDAETRLLMSLCILDSFTPQQAAFVTDKPEAGRTVQRLSANNSLIRYDEQTGTYKMHHIFGAYLQKRLEEQPDGIILPQLFKRAGEWHLKNGDLLPGLKLLVRAGEYDLALTEFEKSEATKVIDRYPQAIMELFQQIPTEVKYRHPIGYLIYAEFYLTSVDMEDGARLLAQIEAYYQGDAATPPTRKKQICGEITLNKNFLFFNDLRKMHEYQFKAYQLLDGSSVIANKDMVVTFGSPHILYLYYREKGEMRWIADYADQVFHYYCEISHGCGAGFEYQVNAEYYLETGDLTRAELCAHKAIYKAETMTQRSIVICANLTLARLRAAQGKFTEAIELITDLNTEVAEENNPIFNSGVDLVMGYIGAILGKPQLIAGWLKAGDVEQSRILYQGLGFNYIIYGKALLLEENYLKLEVLCEEMVQLFSLFNNLFGYLHAHIMNAAAGYKLYGMEKAKDALETALEIGRADGIVLPFAEYGLYILDILEALRKENKGDAYLERLVVETIRYRDSLTGYHGIQEMIPLTEREQEILGRVVQGQTNREIAAGLYIAEITVRKNITAIYRKLEVEGRAAAVRRAVELKLT